MSNFFYLFRKEFVQKFIVAFQAIRQKYCAFPFVFHTVDGCRELLHKADIQILNEVATDGVSELLEDLINTMDAETYRQYLRYHAYICEKPECLGMSNHLLFVGEN